jgi:cytochrome c biogenesis protein CcdA
MGLLPYPKQLVAPGLISGARRRNSGALLGAAFAVCAAPCIGLVLASILVLASDSSTVLVGASLLAVYAAGLAFAFLLAGIGFTQALDAFRWLRDHYGAIKVGSGLLLTALGLLLFFGRAWWLRSIADRALGHLGLGTD